MKEIKDDYCEDLEFCLKEEKKNSIAKRFWVPFIYFQNLFLYLVVNLCFSTNNIKLDKIWIKNSNNKNKTRNIITSNYFSQHKITLKCRKIELKSTTRMKKIKYWWNCKWGGLVDGHVVWQWFVRCLGYVWSCQVSWRLDNHGMPYVWCNLSQSPNHCHLRHAIGGHGCSMCVVVEVEWCCVQAHQCRTQFQGFHGV
jgi:hypothetical protein